MPVGVATDRTSKSRGNRRMVEVGMGGARVRAVTDRASKSRGNRRIIKVRDGRCQSQGCEAPCSFCSGLKIS